MCPVCGGRPTILGRLGRMLWLRCRACGMEWNERDEQSWDEEDDEVER